MEDGGPSKGTMYLDVAGGPARVKWTCYPSEDGGPMKMKVPKPKSLCHDNNATFQSNAKALPKWIWEETE